MLLGRPKMRWNSCSAIHGKGSLRLHPLTGLPKPTVWKIDVFANHAWQVTFELNGTTAELKRIGTHKSIDRDPR
jgi:hypothetical protein